MIGPIVLQIVLIFLNATFASAEIAVISMSETKLKLLASEGNNKALKLVALTEQPARFLATIQVAITLAGLLGSAFAAESFSGPLAQVLIAAGIPVPQNVLESVSVLLITLILAYFNLVFGELVPKRIAMKKAESLALGMSGLLSMVSKVFAPLVWLLTVSTNGLLRMIGINPNEDEEAVTEEEIRLLLTQGREQGNIRTEETEIIQNVFDFNDISAEQICTRRRDVVALYIEDDMDQWDEIIRTNRHSYYPVCGEEPEDIIGVLDTRDYFRAENRSSREQVMQRTVDPVFFVPETTKADALLRKMRQKRTYFAVLLDEYGGLSGIVTLHDLMEKLIGGIEDEETQRKPDDIKKIGEGIWKIQGCAELNDVAQALGISFAEEDYDTFSGYICGIMGRIPGDGECFQCEIQNLTIDVKGVENHVIGETIVRRNL